jgi:hypothetical protein
MNKTAVDQAHQSPFSLPSALSSNQERQPSTEYSGSPSRESSGDLWDARSISSLDALLREPLALLVGGLDPVALCRLTIVRAHGIQADKHNGRPLFVEPPQKERLPQPAKQVNPRGPDHRKNLLTA